MICTYMLGTTYGIEERGIKKGIEQGVKQKRLNIVKKYAVTAYACRRYQKYSGATDGEIWKQENHFCVK